MAIPPTPSPKSVVIPNPINSESTIGTIWDYTLSPDDPTQINLPDRASGPIINNSRVANYAFIYSAEVQNSKSAYLTNASYISLDSGRSSTNEGQFTNLGLLQSWEGDAFINKGTFDNSIAPWFVHEGDNNKLPFVFPWVNDQSIPVPKLENGDPRAMLPSLSFLNAVFFNEAGAVFSIADNGPAPFIPSSPESAKYPRGGDVEFFRSGASLNNSGKVTNNGFIDIFYSNANITNNANGVFENNGRIGISYDNAYILNNGLFKNNGSVTNFEANKGVINNGTWTGSGSVQGPFTDNSKTAPGNSAGGMLIDGDYFKEGGTKQIELAGDNDAGRHRRKTEHDFIDITGDLTINGGTLDVSLIDDFRLERDQEFIISQVDGELTGQYEGLDEGKSVGRFANSDGSKSKLYISYKAGDGNDIALSTNRTIDDIVHANAKPPAGASLLFSAISTEAFIKERKNGSFQMEMKDVESINWFTERPERADGTWKPKKLVKQWDKYFADSEPNAQTTFRVTGIAGEQGFATFEMFKPKITSNNNLKFKVKPLSENGRDSLTDLVGKELDIASLFIDSATPGIPPCFPNCNGADLRGMDMSGKNLFSTFALADFSPNGTIKTNLSGANLSGAILRYADLTGAILGGAILYDADLTNAYLRYADLTNAIHNSWTTWPAEEFWGNTTCPNGSNSNEPGNGTCGFTPG